MKIVRPDINPTFFMDLLFLTTLTVEYLKIKGNIEYVLPLPSSREIYTKHRRVVSG